MEAVNIVDKDRMKDQGQATPRCFLPIIYYC